MIFTRCMHCKCKRRDVYLRFSVLSNLLIAASIMMYTCGNVHTARQWHRTRAIVIARVQSQPIAQAFPGEKPGLGNRSLPIYALTNVSFAQVEHTVRRHRWDNLSNFSRSAAANSSGSKIREFTWIVQLNTEASRRCAKSGRKYMHSPPTGEGDLEGFPLAFNAFCASRWKTMKREWMSGPRKLQGHRALLVMGLLNIAGFDGSGSFVGDIMQWCDLAASLVGLGAQIDVLCGAKDDVFLPDSPQSNIFLGKYSIIFADYHGLHALDKMYQTAHERQEFNAVACRFRIIDAFGTERSFLQRTNRKGRWVPAGVNLREEQFLTFEPHHVQPGFLQNNTFLGYAVSRPHVNRRRPEWRGLLWGKLPVYFKKVMPALRLLCEYIPLSTTTHGIDLPKQCLHSVDRLTVDKYLDFVDGHAVFIGAGEPAMGHAAVEAVAKGLLFINPRHEPPWTVDFGSGTMADSSPVLGGKPTRIAFHYQNTILGDDDSDQAKIYVHNVNMHNLTAVRNAITAIKSIYNDLSNNLTGYRTPLASPDSFSERLVSIVQTDFCALD